MFIHPGCYAGQDPDALPLNTAAATASSHPDTIESNLRLRFTRGDLGNIEPAPEVSRRAVRIAVGGDTLLASCLAGQQNWARDPFIARLAHRHPLSTISCRERSSPGLHVVFYAQPDGSREAWAHFDLSGPGNIPGHLSEVVRNRLTFGRTSEYDARRGLLGPEPGSSDLIAPRYDLRSQARKYENSVIGPQAISAAIASAGFVSMLHLNSAEGSDYAFRDRVAENLARNTVKQSIEFGSAGFLQEDLAMTPSGEHGFTRRARYALYRTFMVPGRDGNELAFPRLAAAFGTGFAMQRWHPSQKAEPSAWTQALLILGKYALRSYWTEFKPEIKHDLHRFLKR